MTRIPELLRTFVTHRERDLCEYCQTAQIIVVSMEIDHIIPEVADGLTIESYLCLTCRACNSFKQDFQTGIDPETGDIVPLFNPRTQIWSDHFKWTINGLNLIGLTPSGRATINRLRINRDGVVASRRLWVQAGWYPPKMDLFPATTIAP